MKQCDAQGMAEGSLGLEGCRVGMARKEWQGLDPEQIYYVKELGLYLVEHHFPVMTMEPSEITIQRKIPITQYA